MSDKNNNVMMNNDMNNNDNDPKERMRKKVKKAAGIALCAVLAGGLAAGSFEGINTLTGWNSSTVEAASSKDNTTLLQTKAKKNKDSSDEKSEDSTDESDSKTKGSLDVSDIAAEGMKSVVSITTKSVQDVQNYLGYYGFGGSQGYTTQQEVEGSGSGIIVGKNDDNLLIATNYHVVSGADTVSVTCIDGETYAATVNGYDEDKDLAVVSVPLSDISDDTMDQIEVATIGSSDDLKVGEQVVAIGNALGYGQSVTTGIVSAKNRKMNDQGIEQDEDSDATNLIQTDAAINPGNSGGALLNMDGEVVGINSAKLASTEVEGMGYAIAISDVTDTLEQLMNETPRDKVDNHGVLGITGMSVSDEASQYYGVPEGVLVSEVTEGGAADEAGIKAKSIITEFDGKRVRSIDELVSRLEYYEPGEEVEVTLEVANGDSYKEKKVTVTLGENPDADSSDSKDSSKDASGDDAQEDTEDQGDQNTDSLLQDFENQQADGTAYEQFFGFLN
ncbi:S1C family serine protease [Blautia sp. MSJ-19]|uniref:S1C family serine protease n=1 Tax=Blautia sp. MSJ-19 TaxID=2841517 RepID=UPI001C0EAED6|nr:trypsin-like peptidase domain-containing protein [Blautia sp. MSJ-19]MBU5482109.1 trypsin-like peptidase domain-containing protein [Blautia sp. MSJ-19]